MMSARDPLLFLLWSVIAVALTGFIDGALFPTCMIVLAIGISLVERLYRKTLFWRAMGYFLFFALSSAWIYAVAPAPGAPSASWWTGLIVGLRIMAAGLISLIFAMSVDRAALCRALVFRVGLSRRLVYGVVAAIAAGPLLADEWAMARHITRSVSTDWRRFVLSFGLFIIVLAGLIRRADDLAIALETRGAALPDPTPWRVPKVQPQDRGLFGLGLFVLLAVALV